MRYPTTICDYLEHCQIDPDTILFMVVSREGTIIDQGTIRHVLNNEPQAGRPAEDYIWSFIGLFPLNSNLYLPNIQLSPMKYYNLHLIEDNGLIWILVDQQHESETDRLCNTSTLVLDQKKEITLLDGLGYLVFNRTTDGNCITYNKIPDWAVDLFSGEVSRDHCVTEIFPYLQGFVSLIPIYQPGEKMVKKSAGIWSQKSSSGHEFLLQAWALLYKTEAYLVISEVESGNGNEVFIKSTREHALAFEQLQNTRNQLQELVRLKDQFVNIISHDYRSPISTLIEGVTYLQDVLKSSPQIGTLELDIVAQVKSELVRLLDYNNKLYNWTQLNLDTLELNLESVPVKMILDSATSHFQQRLKEKNLRLSVSIQDGAVVTTDYVLMTQAIFNLIDNAIKFSKEEGQIFIEASSRQISIKDQGIGIPEHYIEGMKQGSILKSIRGTRGEMGTGLGLSIVYRILKTLNLHMDITSDPDQGTFFIIFFF